MNSTVEEVLNRASFDMNDMQDYTTKLLWMHHNGQCSTRWLADTLKNYIHYGIMDNIVEIYYVKTN